MQAYKPSFDDKLAHLKNKIKTYVHAEHHCWEEYKKTRDDEWKLKAKLNRAKSDALKSAYQVMK